ncbi:hypothetical protein [Corynebacterium lubricantis]|uniref:hypothetical protein n=1 Tax=Corynebacterium lubricantis TaxID=541095 RepID=UPI000366EB0F|nr:hypothetical protein [Corynebacterium lubricantis]
MASTLTRATALITAAGVSLALASCSSNGEDANAESTLTPTTGVATTAEAADAEFAVEQRDPITTDNLSGPVEDPATEITYHWQGVTTPPAGGGTIVTVAVTNTSDAPMPPEALGTPKLGYRDSTGGSLTEVDELSAENAAFEGILGLDQQLGAGATSNVQFAFDVANSSLWAADFTIGNVTFSGNLNS